MMLVGAVFCVVGAVVGETTGLGVFLLGLGFVVVDVMEAMRSKPTSC